MHALSIASPLQEHSYIIVSRRYINEKNADSNVKHKYNTNIMKIKLINKKNKNIIVLTLTGFEPVCCFWCLMKGCVVIYTDALNPSAIWAYYSIGIQCIKMAKNQVLRDITHR